MKNKTISSDSHHFIIINYVNIKIHQSWIACYRKRILGWVKRRKYTLFRKNKYCERILWEE